MPVYASTTEDEVTAKSVADVVTAGNEADVKIAVGRKYVCTGDIEAIAENVEDPKSVSTVGKRVGVSSAVEVQSARTIAAEVSVTSAKKMIALRNITIHNINISSKCVVSDMSHFFFCRRHQIEKYIFFFIVLQ